MPYLVTTLNNEKTPGRCVGMFLTLGEAQSIVEQNTCDIHENSYDFVVVEDVAFGLYPAILSEYWYHWEQKNGVEQYVQCEKPGHLSHITNFSIG